MAWQDFEEWRHALPLPKERALKMLEDLGIDPMTIDKIRADMLGSKEAARLQNTFWRVKGGSRLKRQVVLSFAPLIPLRASAPVGKPVVALSVEEYATEQAALYRANELHKAGCLYRAAITSGAGEAGLETELLWSEIEILDWIHRENARYQAVKDPAAPFGRHSFLCAKTTAL